MEFRYNLRGANRKKLALAVGEILTQPVVYSGPPTYAYSIYNFMVDRNGSLIFPHGTSQNYARLFVAALAERGFESEDFGITEPETSNPAIEMSRADFTDTAIQNLRKLIANKAELFKKALGADSLEFEITEHKLRFPWFNRELSSEEFTAYAWFISALCKLAKSLKRVNSSDREIVNEKLTMRLFLIRLGFVGDNHKSTRKILMRNLTGNSAWKNAP